MVELVRDNLVELAARAVPRRVGRYEICYELASGGMATIYLARVQGPGGFMKLVALKCIHPHLVKQEGFVEMFFDEARVASRIQHPNVCHVFDFGFADGVYFIAMEFLVGETASRLQDSVRMPGLERLPAQPYCVARVISDAALGLHAAHTLVGDDGQLLQVVHRDVSPQNIMVTYDGAVKVMDFGIASAADQLHLTGTGTLRGKFPYMAPEQVEQRGVDRRADVWSLGVVLWELLTGESLFRRERQVDTMRAVLEAPIPAPSQRVPGLPRELDAVTLRALQRDPTERFEDAQELSEALEQVRDRNGHIASQGQLGQWLRALFPDLHGRRMELQEKARQQRENRIPRISRALSEPTVQTRRLSDATSRPRAGRRGSPARPRAIALAAALVVGLLLVAGAFYLGWSAQKPLAVPAPTVVLPPPAPPPSPATQSAAAPPPARAVPPAAPAEATPAPPVKNPARGERTRRWGHVNLATPGGWADVYYQGAKLGRTPTRIRLPAGRRALVIKPFGRSAMRRSVRVREGQVTRLVVPVGSHAVRSP